MSMPQRYAGWLNREAHSAEEIKAAVMRAAAKELERGEAQQRKLKVVLDVAMNTLEQIATTPRNAGARRNAQATLHFLQTQLDAQDALEQK